MKNFFTVLFFTLVFACSCHKDSIVLNGYKWKLISVYQKNLPDSITATLILDEYKGTYEGYSGCNALFGDCTISGASLYFSRIGITYKYCGEISDWEALLIKALKETNKYEVDAGRLLLVKGDEIVATWR